MATNQVNVGIIGLGAVGERLLKQFNQHPNTKVAAVCDTRNDRMEAIQSLVEDVQIYQDYHELLKNEDITLVYVAVPPKFHHQMVLDTVRAGKHVLCEKPLANSYKEAEEMLAAVEEANVVHAINFPLPYSDAVHELKNRMAAHSLGEIKRVDLSMHFPVWPRTWQQNPWIAGREQGGFVREITPHYIQLIHDLFGETQNVNTFIDYPDNKDHCETSVIARLETNNGVPILINGLSGIGQKEEISFKIYGSEGTIALKNWGLLEGETSDKGKYSIAVAENNEHYDLISEILKAINQNPAHLVTFKEGLAVQKVLEQLLGK